MEGDRKQSKNLKSDEKEPILRNEGIRSLERLVISELRC